MLGETLRTLRMSSGLTMEALAEKIGVSRQSVAKWENNESLPDLLKCKALADLYNVSLDGLVNGGPDEVLREHDGEVKFLFGVVKVDEENRIVIPEKAREVFHIASGDELLVVGDKRKGMAMVKLNGTADFFSYGREY